MNNKIVIGVIVVIIIILLGLQQWVIYNRVPEVPNSELLRSLDSLKSQIDSLNFTRDSLRTVIDTNKVQIIEIEKRYETIRDRIINQSVDSDCITFSNYLSSYQRLSSLNNASTAKNN